MLPVPIPLENTLMEAAFEEVKGDLRIRVTFKNYYIYSRSVGEWRQLITIYSCDATAQREDEGMEYPWEFIKTWVHSGDGNHMGPLEISQEKAKEIVANTDFQKEAPQKHPLRRISRALTFKLPGTEKNLKSTVKGMLSDDWKERLKAEYEQAVIRKSKLYWYLQALEEKLLPAIPTYKKNALLKQLHIMCRYTSMLKRRAHYDGIELKDKPFPGPKPKRSLENG